MKKMQSFKTDKGIEIKDIRLADDFIARLAGYMFAENPGSGGILFKNCNAIHSYFMKFDIDLLFLDETMRLVHTEYGFKKNRTISVKNARHVLELPSGVIAKGSITVGDVLYDI